MVWLFIWRDQVWKCNVSATGNNAVIFSVPQRKDEIIDKVGKLYSETSTTNSSKLFQLL